MYIRAFPTWCITLMAVPFLPKSHPWHGRYFKIKDWYDRQTKLCMYFDIFFWLTGIELVCLLIFIKLYVE